MGQAAGAAGSHIGRSGLGLRGACQRALAGASGAFEAMRVSVLDAKSTDVTVLHRSKERPRRERPATAPRRWAVRRNRVVLLQHGESYSHRAERGGDEIMSSAACLDDASRVRTIVQVVPVPSWPDLVGRAAGEPAARVMPIPRLSGGEAGVGEGAAVRGGAQTVEAVVVKAADPSNFWVKEKNDRNRSRVAAAVRAHSSPMLEPGNCQPVVGMWEEVPCRRISI